jgi:hypothetical protein
MGKDTDYLPQVYCHWTDMGIVSLLIIEAWWLNG